jgi:hypothetical protein
LSEHGRRLWDAVNREFVVEDIGSLEALLQACQSLDRAEQLAEQIKHDGVVIVTSNGDLRDHPALKHEVAVRSFTVRTLRGLGLNDEPVRSGVGRPPSSVA